MKRLITIGRTGVAVVVGAAFLLLIIATVLMSGLGDGSHP